jgi:hypothetical protein
MIVKAFAKPGWQINTTTARCKVEPVVDWQAAPDKRHVAACETTTAVINSKTLNEAPCRDDSDVVTSDDDAPREKRNEQQRRRRRADAKVQRAAALKVQRVEGKGLKPTAKPAQKVMA